MSDRIIVVNGQEQSLDEYIKAHPEEFYPVDRNGNIQGAIPISPGTAANIQNSSTAKIVELPFNDLVIKTVK